VGATAPRWLDDEESRAWRSWILTANRLRSQLARDLLVETGLSWADYEVLVHLSEAEGQRMRMSELALRLDWSKSRLSHQVSRMAERGLLHREECPSDARGSFAALDAAGLEEIRRAAPAHVESVRRHLVDVLGRDELSQLGALCERVLEHLRDESVCREAQADASGFLAEAGPK
jgi:DNA-binding MarR family transcriptional regulator